MDDNFAIQLFQGNKQRLKHDGIETVTICHALKRRPAEALPLPPNESMVDL